MKNKDNKKKIITLSIISTILVLSAIAGTLYEKNDKARNFFDKYVFLKEKHEDNLPYILLNGLEEVNFFAFKDNILILKDNILTIYNKNGNEEKSIDIAISNPIFKAEGDYLCIAEKGGNSVYVIYNKNILWQKELENSISDVIINENGYVAVSLTGTTYKTMIQTFDNKGVELFKTFLSSTYVVDMDISPDNKYLAIAEINVSGILIQSNIKIISIDKAKSGDNDYITYIYQSVSGDLIVNLKYQNRNELVCIYDNHIDTVKNETNSLIAEFKEEDVLFVDVNNKIIKVIKNNSKVYLQVINPSGTVKDFEIDEPKNIYVYDDVIAINLGSEVLFYNNSGWLIKKYYAKQEINKIILCNGLAGIIYNDKIELISL